MNRFLSYTYKELLLLTRDMHGLLLLFVMPTIFILLMTFALQNQYSASSDMQLGYFLLNLDGEADSQRFEQDLLSTNNLNRLEHGTDLDHLRQRTARDESSFLLIIHPDFSANINDGKKAVSLELAPGTAPVVTQLVSAQLQQFINRIFLEKLLIKELDMTAEQAASIEAGDFLEISSLFGEARQQPSSVQQNVPAWLLFAMFFIAIPLSTTLIHERQQGTAARLNTMNFPKSLMLASKVTPYFLINLLQVGCMLLIGVYLVPWLGGDKLELIGSTAGLLTISAAAAFAAVAYGLLIAQVARTVDQATIFSGVCNIIMAAVGGVMVPRFIMPPTMQELSAYSPMAWGLDGFFDILLRNGGVIEVLPEAFKLMVFAGVLLLITLFLSARKQA